MSLLCFLLTPVHFHAFSETPLQSLRSPIPQLQNGNTQNSINPPVLSVSKRQDGLGRKRKCDGCLFVGGLTSQQHASIFQGRICSGNFTCCHTETEVADQTFYLTQSQYTDTGPTNLNADPITPGAWQGSSWSAKF